MTDERNEERLTAYLDEELTPEERAEVDLRLETDPAMAAELEAMRGVGDILRRAADEWERDVSFDGFYEKVAARLDPIESAAPSLLSRFENWLQWSVRHPATAAAFTILIVMGAGSAYWASRSAPIPVLHMRGGAVQIENLDFENSSAVVYKTDSDVTIIWLSDEDPQ